MGPAGQSVKQSVDRSPFDRKNRTAINCPLPLIRTCGPNVKLRSLTNTRGDLCKDLHLAQSPRQGGTSKQASDKTQSGQSRQSGEMMRNANIKQELQG